MLARAAFFAVCLISVVTSAPQKAPKADETFKLIILHNNDMHARFEQTSQSSDKCTKTDADAGKCYGGFARVAHKVREYRALADAGEIPKVLYLNAGDTYTGTPWFAIFKDQIAVDFLEILKPDAISLGNHEFDEGTDNLADFLKAVDFPVLAANLDISLTPELNQPSLVPSITREIDGRQVGIIGYLTPETKEVAAGNKVEFEDEVVAINLEAAKLKAAGVNIIIALGHSGLERDKQIAAQCHEVDLVIGGHSHSFLFTGTAPDSNTPVDDYPVVITQGSGKRVPVVQAFAYTKYLGYLHLEFDDEGNLLETIGEPILLDNSVPRDPDVLAKLEIYRPEVLALENEIVGITRVYLDGNCRRRECNLGNFLADSMVDWYSMKYTGSEYWTDASIALLQSGGIRANIDHKGNGGNITKEDVSAVFPFKNKLQIVEVTGKDLLAALEHSVHRYHEIDEHGEFFQVSGVRVVYDINRPSYSRVVEAKVLCAQCSVPQMEEIDEEKSYKVILQDFIANGGDGYKMFKKSSVPKFEELDVDVFARYIKKLSPIYPAVTWRISFVNGTQRI